MFAEIISNNAAAGLVLPIALNIAKKTAVSYKPFMFCVMAGASCAFITPVGYQCNVSSRAYFATWRLHAHMNACSCNAFHCPCTMY